MLFLLDFLSYVNLIMCGFFVFIIIFLVGLT